MSNTEKVQRALHKLGAGDSVEIKEIPRSTRTSAEAANALGCEISEIAKSIVFRGGNTGKPILVIASGSNRINEDKVRERTRESLEKASPNFVKEQTGFPIGGVSPVGHIKEIDTFIDQDLMRLEKVWAAAGTPNSVFSINPEKLAEITGGEVIDIS